MQFTECVGALRHWFAEHGTLPDKGTIKVTIEAPTPDIAWTALSQLKAEFDPRAIHLDGIDIGRPFEIMGIEFTFRLPEQQRMPRANDGLS